MAIWHEKKRFVRENRSGRENLDGWKWLRVKMTSHQALGLRKAGYAGKTLYRKAFKHF